MTNLPFLPHYEVLNFMNFHNILYGIIISIFSILISIKAGIYYVKNKDKCMLAIAVGFFTGGIFEICHFLSFNDLNLQFFYVFFKNLVYSSTILIAIFTTTYIKETSTKKFNFVIFLSLLLLFIIVSTLTILSYIDFFNVNISHSSVGVIFSALYILSAFIYSDMRSNSNLKPVSGFIIGLILIGFSQLYISNIDYYSSSYRHITHFLNITGLFLIFIELKSILHNENKLLSIKQKLLIYPTLFLILSYLVLVLFCSLCIKIDLPIYVNYFLLIFLIGNTVIQNYLAAKLTDPLTKIIKSLPVQMHFSSNDETGILTNTINESSDLIYQYCQEIGTKQSQIEEYIEREKLLRKVTESIIYNSDIHEALEDISKEIAQYFNLEYVSIAHIPEINPKTFEFLTRFCIDDTKLNQNYDDKLLEYWHDLLQNEEYYIAINNLQEADFPYFFKEFYLNQGSKSILFVKIKKDNNVWGGIGLQTFCDFRRWTDKEIEFLKAIAYQIYIAVKHAELYLKTKKQAEKEALIRKITETIRSTLDINEVLTIICDEVAKVFDVQRATIIELPDPKNCEENIVRREYKISPDIKDLSDTAFDYNTRIYWNKKALVEGTSLIIDNIPKSETPDYFKKSYEAIGVKSILGFPVKKDKKVWGVIVLSEYTSYRHWTEDEINLLQTIADQVYIAIEQAELYSTTKKQADREALLRNIISTCRSTFDIDQIKKNIEESIGKSLNLDRCIILEYDSLNDIPLPIDEHSEYRSSENVKSLIGFDFNKKEFNFFRKLDNKKYGFFGTNSTAVSEEYKKNLNEVIIKYYEDYNIKAGFQVPLFYGNHYLGSIIGHYENPHNEFSEEEKEFIRTIANQTGIALHQAKLYSTTKKQADREALLRKIIESSRSTLDINETKKIIVNETGKAFNADRCFFVEYDQNEDALPIDQYSEYLASKDDYSLVGIDLEKKYNHKYWTEQLKLTKSELIVTDLTQYIKDNKLEGTPIDQYFKDINFKTGSGFPIFHENKLTGLLIIDYTKIVKELSNEDIQFIKTLVNQISIALRQSELYIKEKKTAEREELLRKVVETIRSTLDINEIFNVICNEISKLFNLERVSITEFPNKQDYGEFYNRGKYISCKGIKEPDKTFVDPRVTIYLATNILDYGNNIVIDNISRSNSPDFIKSFYENLGVKSLTGIPVKRGEDKWGGLFLAEYENYRKWTEDEISLLQTIADQVYIAIKQAELYSTTKEFADRESLLREVIDTIRSTLDINEIKRTFVNEIGLYFKADRVVFSEFDTEKNVFLATDTYSEYLCTPDISSFIGYDWSLHEGRPYIDRLVEQNEIIITDLDKYLKEHNLENSDFEKLFKGWKVKSSYNIVIMYGQEIMGFFCIDYLKENFKINNNELEFLRTLANQAGIALYQSRLFNHLRQTAKNEQTIAKIISTIKSSLNIDEILMLICNKLTHLFNVTRISIDEFNPLTRNIQTYKIYNFDVSKDFNPNYDIQTREFLFDHLINKGANLIIDNIQNSDLPNKEFLIDNNLLSILAIPLRISENRWGAIFVYDKNIRKWTKSEINLLGKIADYISLAIRDSNLYTQAQFVANVSHELKTPIAIINGYTETLINRDKEMSKMATKFLPIIKNNTDRINAIVGNLLYLSNINNNHNSEQIDFKKIELKQIIEEVIQNLLERSQAKSIIIDLNYNGPLFANVNEFMIYQAFINLINNAINYSENNTIITINAYKDNNKAIIEFQDQGCGIKEEHLPYIFERFYRVDKSRNRETGGTGLGLSIVKSILDFHGGIISVNSKFSEGSIFIIELDYIE